MKIRAFKRSPLWGLAAVGASLLLMLLFPGSAGAWTSPCNPAPNVRALDGTMKVAPDGTIYAIVIDPYTDADHIFSWKPPSCSATVYSIPSSPGAVFKPHGILPQDTAAAIQPKLAVGPNGDVAVTYFFSPCGACQSLVRMQIKRAGSNTFGAPIAFPTPPGGIPAYGGGVAIDSAGFIHVVWWTTSAFYQRYDLSGKKVGPQITLSSDGGYPNVAVDQSNNAHVVWQQCARNCAPHPIRYVEISPKWVMGTTRTISNTSVSNYPFIAVDASGSLQIIWSGAIGGAWQVLYTTCQAGGTGCSAPVNLSHSTGGAFHPGLAVCSTTPFVSWDSQDSGVNSTYVSANLSAGQIVTGGNYGTFPIIAGGADSNGNGFVGVLYRARTPAVSIPTFTSQTYSACNSGGGGPPTITPTPTATPTPCVSNCPLPPTNISNDNASSLSAVAVDSGNQVYMTWADHSPGQFDIFARVRHPDSSFSPPQNVSHDPENSVWPSMDRQLLASGAVAVWTDNSGAGGYNVFLSRLTPPNGTGSSPLTLYLTSANQSYPDVAVTTDGHAWGVWQQGLNIWARRDNKTQLRNVTANGASNKVPRAAPGQAGQLYIVWQQGSSTFSRCHAQGSSTITRVLLNYWTGFAWRPPRSVINLSPGVKSAVTDPDIATFGSTIYVVFSADNGVSGARQIWINSSPNGGVTWSGPSPYAASSGNAQCPRIAVDSTGQVDITWSDGGQIWAKFGPNPPIVVSGTVASSEYPAIAAGPDNEANITWDDTLNAWYTRRP